ncbi:unnamed protein product [Miscanthus lutarioriparius]|uniref:Uncharacterized protein n=1 Tax=Miscanthus lutarioriparius TaxID=422564 RepID=A0A811PYK0_9POAL|nr:unnamed protein product [Miscanthus lutarioriparius]
MERSLILQLDRHTRFHATHLQGAHWSCGLKVWVFISGDTDTAVPLSGTRRSLAALGLPVKTSWYPWHMVSTEVGGWSMEYEGLTYVTVCGAGHEVPLHRPEQAFFLFKQFLQGDPMPAEASFNYFRHTLIRNITCLWNL